MKTFLIIMGILTGIGTLYGWTLAYGLMKKTSMSEEDWERLHSEK